MTGPLSGIRVLDFCWVYAGPVMTRVLADLGAEVIKVESSKRPDGTRLGRRPMEPVLPVPEGVNIELEGQPLNHALNRGKRSLSIDITSPVGRQLILDLVAISDVVTDNFAAGTLERLGLGFDVLREVNSQIVAVSMSGTGQFGRLRDVPAYATSLAALSGLSSLVGEDNHLYGIMMPTYGDSNAAIRAGGSLLVALLQALRSGRAQNVDVSEWEAALVGLEEAFVSYQLNGTTPEPRGNESDSASPHNTYRCQGEDEWVAISVSSDTQWLELCTVFGVSVSIGDGKFTTVSGRLRHRRELDSLVESWTQTWDAMEVASSLQARGVRAFPVMSIESQFSDSHFIERRTFSEVEHPLFGTEIVPGLPFRVVTLEGEVGPVTRAAPLLGEANRYVLCELLGKSEEEFAMLVASGVVS